MASEFQVDPAFPPDKEATWTVPKEGDGMVLAHNAIRGELSCLIQAVDATWKRGTFQEWEMSAVKNMWASHFIHMNAYRQKEEHAYEPFLQKRIKVPKSETLDLSVIFHHLETLERLIQDLPTSEPKTQISLIKEALAAYDAAMKPHLLQKEATILPLIRAYFTATEWSKMLRETSQNDPHQTMGAFIHFQTEQRFRTVFMKQEGIPGFVWYLAFRGLYNAYKKEFLQPYEVLIK